MADTLITLPMAARTAAGSVSCDTTFVTYATWDLTLQSFQGGTSPTVQFYLERQGADGEWYQIGTTGALSTASVFTVDVSPGLNGSISGGASQVQHNVFTNTARVRWVYTGAPTSVTFSCSLTGRK